jgi:hypothetical protein
MVSVGASVACNLSHQKMHVYGVPHLHHLAVFQAIHSRSGILDTPACRSDASKLSCVRAAVGDPRRHPGPFSNLLFDGHLQVWKRPADLSNPRDLSRQVGGAIERRSRCEIALACDDGPVLGDFAQVGANHRFVALPKALVRHRLCSREGRRDGHCQGY